MSENQKRLSFIISCVYYSLIALIVFLFIKYLSGPLLPFITAFAIVSFSRRFILRFEELCRSKRFASTVFTVLLVLILSLLVYGVSYGILNELNTLSETLSQGTASELLSGISDKFRAFFERFSSSRLLANIIKKASENFGDIGSMLSSALSSLVPAVISATMRFISFFPSAVIFLCFTFLATFYISCDYEKICRFIIMQLPEKYVDTLDETRSLILSAAKELFKSYFLLTFITFLQLLLGFLIIGIDYALLLALIISIIDLLPILGTGTVLLPWAAVAFIVDDVTTGAGLIVLYAVITIFRQVAQPKIIGSGTGIPPLLSLISIFAGLKFFGFIGIIIFPVITSTAVKLNQKGIIRLYRYYPEKSGGDIENKRKKFIRFKQQDKHNS